MTAILRTPAEAAFEAGVQVATLRQWVRREHISPPVNGRYDLDEIEKYSARRDVEAFRRAFAGRTRRGERRAGACETASGL